MKRETILLDSIDDVKEEHVKAARNGDIVEFFSKRGALRAVSSKKVRKAVNGKIEVHTRLIMWDGRKWGALSNECARVFDMELAERREERKRAEKEARKEKARKAAEAVQVGDIFASSWGYDQTNVEFYQVVAKNGQYITVREIEAVSTYDTWGSGSKVPVKDSFVKNCLWNEDWNANGKRCKVGPFGYIKITSDGVVTASKWDGEPMYFSTWA